MREVAFIFPGQGSQYVGMGRALAAASPAAATIFEAADSALGEPLSRLAWTGPAADLDQTVNAQPAILATSIAYLRAAEESWRDRGAAAWQPRFLAGHSMGQYSALVASGALTLGDGLKLVRERGRQMQASATDGAMAAVIGLEDARLAELEAAGREVGPLTIANRNSPGQVVVSGARAAVERAMETAKGLGAKRAVLLPVSVAAHSPLMERAAAGMRTALSRATFSDPHVPLLANADTRLLTTADLCREELVDHLTRGVDWISAVQTMRAAGVTVFAEIGPGRVLAGLVKRIAPDVTVFALDDSAAPGRLAMPPTDALDDDDSIASRQQTVMFEPPDPGEGSGPDDPLTPKPA